MCALYPDPEHPWDYISVTEADPQLDALPTPDEGPVHAIEHEHNHACSDIHWHRC